MKFTINGYEVEIKAKSPYSNRCNKNDTVEILNMISLYAGSAERYWKSQGMNAIAKSAGNVSTEIYEQLKILGVYNPFNEI